MDIIYWLVGEERWRGIVIWQVRLTKNETSKNETSKNETLRERQSNLSHKAATLLQEKLNFKEI